MTRVKDGMADNENQPLPAAVLQAFAPLHKSAMGVACGVVLGGIVFLMTAVLLLKGGEVVGPNLALLGQFFLDYSVTWPGAFIGLLWGFVAGFILGWGFALLRNLSIWIWLTVVRTRAEMKQYGDSSCWEWCSVSCWGWDYF